MSRHRTTVVAAGLLLAGILLWQATRIGPESPPPPANGGPAAPAPDATRRPDSAPAGRSTLADALNAPNTGIRADLRLVSEILDTFRTNFLPTGNPTGTNAEITAALTGRNRLRLALIPPDHPAINRAGELCDRWGTPFFFHAESATRMEIRSAGPDRRMWNEDDVVLSP